MEYIRKQSLLADLNETTPHSYFAFETMVRAYPTEDVAPVIHAHWIDYGEVVECSHCEWYARFETHYCPNCGAIMDMDRRDNDRWQRPEELGVKECPVCGEEGNDE